MRIAWIADYKLSEHLGGAQQTNACMIEYGRDLGYNVIEVTPREFDAGIDVGLVILNNITMFRQEDITRLAQRVPTIRYEHDEVIAQTFPQVFDLTILNIFLSPLHKKRCEMFAGRELKGICLPSPIDTDIFNLDGLNKKENTVIWVGSTEKHKGFDKILEYARNNPDKRVSIVSFDYKPQELPENVTFVGERHGEALAQLYREHELFYHHPEHEAFGRTVMEAYLCGCKLDVNENVGALSYGWDLGDYLGIRKQLQSQFRFWDIVMEAYEKECGIEDFI